MHNREHKRFEVTATKAYIIILCYLLASDEFDISRFISFFFVRKEGGAADFSIS